MLLPAGSCTAIACQSVGAQARMRSAIEGAIEGGGPIGDFRVIASWEQPREAATLPPDPSVPALAHTHTQPPPPPPPGASWTWCT